MEKEISIYIHIPFCINKCFYCDFTSFKGKDNLIERYIYAVCNEILKNAEILSSYSIKTIYIGGGTPSYIDSKYIKQIMDTLSLFIDKSKLEEVTIEVNPNSISLEKLKEYKECGINRISIGLQSIYNDILKKIGRSHSIEDFNKAIDNINAAKIDNISLDLIYPLPELDLEKLKETIKYVVGLKEKNLKHISIYNLEVHEGTKLDFLLKEGYLSLTDENEEYLMYEYIKDTLQKEGYYRYEISNYALDGYESKHNNVYWSQNEYLGFGAAASSFFSGARYQNDESIEKYIEKIEQDKSTVIQKDELDLLDLMKEFIILGLRNVEGISKQKFKQRFKKDIHEIFSNEIKELVSNGLLVQNKNYICLSQRGLEIANTVWEKFI